MSDDKDKPIESVEAKDQDASNTAEIDESKVDGVDAAAEGDAPENSLQNSSQDSPQSSAASISEDDYLDTIRAVVMGQVMSQMPKDLFIPPDALEVVLDSFEGPLDLLLYLIRKQNINILNIPVADITCAIHGICGINA